MDARYTGKRILKFRKNKGLTQKALAEKLHVTDKAVSKWERGINFPDLYLLEPLAEELDTSAVELLGLEGKPNEQIALDMADLAWQEKIDMMREIENRGWLTIILGVFVMAGGLVVSRIMADNNLFGLPQAIIGVISGMMGIIIANGMVSIWKGRKLRKFSK